MTFLRRWFPRRVTDDTRLILTRMQEVGNMVDEVKAAVDLVRDDLAQLTANVAVLQGTADTLAKKLADAINALPSTPDNGPILDELRAIHGAAQDLSTAIAATVTKDTPADTPTA